MIKDPVLKTTLSILSVATTAFVLSRYALLIRHLLRIHYDWRFEVCMVIGQLLFQFPFIFRFSWNKKGDYFYNMLMVSLIGSVLLSPLVLFNQFVRLSDTVNLIYFFTVVLIMFIEHKRRVKRLSLPAYISYTWVLYRVIILVFII